MKKFAISLLALAAVSTVAFAANGDGYRDADYISRHSNQVSNVSMNSDAYAVANQDTGALTAFERMKKLQEENENGGR